MSNQFYCNRCGGLFNCSPKARPTWCDECRKQEQKEYQAEYYRRRKSELSRLRAANAELVEALEKIARGVDCPEGIIKRPDFYASQDYFEHIANEALSRAEQAKPEPEPETCVWAWCCFGNWHTFCGNDWGGVDRPDICPFCGRRIEVKG